ncbi:MAG: NUDIX hydrolase [Candidatus Pacebacteria bacterium]|nr:NUDIX hydrolase [Candidatus Paceibacterota bacterium]
MKGIAMEAAVTIALLDAAGDVLLVRDLGHTDPQWKFPGGHVKPEETPAVAVIRETKEESGVSVSENLLQVLDTELRPSREGGTHKHIFFGATLPGTFKERGLKDYGASGEETRIVSLHKLDSLLEFEPHRALLKKLHNQAFYA